MKVRGLRECNSCGVRWSYYDTGEITCPECGSIRSVGVDDPTEHTGGPVELDLSAVRDRVDQEPVRQVAERATEDTRAYLGRVGFVHAGDLQPLPDTYLGAAELRRVASTLATRLRVSDSETAYFLSLLRGVDRGERPAPEDVQETFQPERGLAVTASVEAYLSDLRRVLPEDTEPEVSRVLSTISTHRKRIDALDGDVPPTDAERLVLVTRDLSAYLREGEESALARAGNRFEDDSYTDRRTRR